MKLETDERKFLKDLISYAKNTPGDFEETLKGANIALKRSLEETKDFGPFEKEEEEIIQGLFDKDILKIKIEEREIHQSLDENDRSKRKDLLKGLGIREDRMEEVLDELDEK